LNLLRIKRCRRYLDRRHQNATFHVWTLVQGHKYRHNDRDVCVPPTNAFQTSPGSCMPWIKLSWSPKHHFPLHGVSLNPVDDPRYAQIPRWGVREGDGERERGMVNERVHLDTRRHQELRRTIICVHIKATFPDSFGAPKLKANRYHTPVWKGCQTPFFGGPETLSLCSAVSPSHVL
jgi:hypothetical protein